MIYQLTIYRDLFYSAKKISSVEVGEGDFMKAVSEMAKFLNRNKFMEIRLVPNPGKVGRPRVVRPTRNGI
jgi:hypothetical protein